MPRIRHLLALVVTMGLVAPALGQDSVDLKWKFDKGKTFYQEMSTETNQEMNVMGMNITQKQKQTFDLSYTPVKQNDDKSWTIKQKIEAIKMDIQIGGNPVTFDSTKDMSGSNALSDFLKALVGTEFTITVSPDMKVTKIEGREEFLKKLNSVNPQMQGLLNQILSEEALKQMSDPAFAVVPNKAVKQGDSWEKKATLNMGPIGSYDSTYKYTAEGKDDNNKDLQKIKVDSTLKYVPPSGGAASGLPFQITKANLTSKDSSGTVLFDVAKGRVSSSNLTTKLDGTLNITIGGTNSEVKLNQTQNTTVKTSDENPVKKTGT